MNVTNIRTLLAVAALTIVAGVANANGAEHVGKPNGGKAEKLGREVGGMIGAAAGGAAGARNAGVAGGSAGAAAGQKLGESAGAVAGRVLDQHAAENARTGRGGSADPRFDPRSVFNQ